MKYRLPDGRVIEANGNADLKAKLALAGIANYVVVPKQGPPLVGTVAVATTVIEE